MKEIRATDVVSELDYAIAHRSIVLAFRILKLSRFRFLKRKSFSLKYKALTIVLWRLALDQCYPHDSEMIFYLAQIYPSYEHLRKFFKNRYILRLFKENISVKGGNPDFSQVTQILINDFMVSKPDNTLESAKSELIQIISKYYDHFLECYMDSHVIKIQEDFNNWVPDVYNLRIFH